MADPHPATEPTPEAVIAANVRHRRKRLGISQTELGDRATKAGCPLGDMAVWSIENGKRRVNVDDLFALAEGLETTPRQLLSERPEDMVSEQTYEVRLDGGIAELITADRVETDARGWLNFFVEGERIFFAPAVRVLYVRVREAS